LRNRRWPCSNTPGEHGRADLRCDLSLSFCKKRVLTAGHPVQRRVICTPASMTTAGYYAGHAAFKCGRVVEDEQSQPLRPPYILVMKPSMQVPRPTHHFEISPVFKSVLRGVLRGVLTIRSYAVLDSYHFWDQSPHTYGPDPYTYETEPCGRIFLLWKCSKECRLVKATVAAHFSIAARERSGGQHLRCHDLDCAALAGGMPAYNTWRAPCWRGSFPPACDCVTSLSF
jgi:hypothetical protein